jgi:hypothetical protein
MVKFSNFKARALEYENLTISRGEISQSTCSSGEFIYIYIYIHWWLSSFPLIFTHNNKFYSFSRHSSGSTEETMKLMKNEQKDVEITKPEPLPKVWVF